MDARTCTNSGKCVDLRRHNNPAFQNNAWRHGCQIAHESSSSWADCEDAVPDNGCCSLADAEPNRCRSNSCSGGQCCNAAHDIGVLACQAYHDGITDAGPPYATTPAATVVSSCVSDGCRQTTFTFSDPSASAGLSVEIGTPNGTVSMSFTDNVRAYG